MVRMLHLHVSPHIPRISGASERHFGFFGVDGNKLHPRWVAPAPEAVAARLATLGRRASLDCAVDGGLWNEGRFFVRNDAGRSAARPTK